MAKRSSRKSSSGDEALLWGIAAVVVAVAGVGAAIMLTRSKSVCGDVQCSKNQDKNPKPTSKTDCCVNKPEPAACTVQGGNGTCTSQVNSQGKRNCVGGNQLCGVNLDAHKNAHSDEDTCDKIFNKYKDNMIKCNTGYTASVEKDGQNNCLFKCGSTPAAPKKPKKKKKQAGQCCAPSGLAEGVCGATTTEEKCRGSCVWNPNGCIKENFRMRRWRR